MKRRNLMFLPAALALAVIAYALATTANNYAKPDKAQTHEVAEKAPPTNEEPPMDSQPLGEMSYHPEARPVPNWPDEVCHPMTGCESK